MQLQNQDMKDLKKEIERYTRNNYPRKEIIQRLERDGFDISEINEEMSQEMEAAEDRIVMNMLYFFPSILYILVLVLISMLGISKIDNIAGKVASFVVLVGLLVLGYHYYREKKVTFLIVSVLMYIGLASLFVACAARIANDFKIPLLNYFTMAFGVLYLYFFAKENLWIYKLKQKSLF